MVLATARPELHDSRPGWGGGRRNSTTVGLSPLSDDDTARLVAALLERSVLPAETQAALLERAGGNPLYTEQFVRMHVDREHSGDALLPETVQALIAARLDTLVPELKGILHDASILGKVFWTGALTAMGNRSRDDVLAGLRDLVRREFVRPARVSSMREEEEFSFWHALVRDVAYQQIPRAARAAKHVQAAEWIEAGSDERVSDHAEILVHHYEQALELGRATSDQNAAALEPRLARFLILAGDRAMRLDMAAAEASYRRALELSGESAARAVPLVKLGDSLQEQGRLPEAEEAYDEGLSALRSAGDAHAAAVAMLGLARALWRHGYTTRARELSLEAIAILERDPGPDLVAAYERAAGADAIGGRSDEAVAWAEKAIALAGHLGIENVVRSLQMRGLARINLDEPAAGLEDLREALALSLRLGLGIETAVSYLNLGEMVGVFESLAEGRELTEASLEFSQRRGLMHNVMWTRAALLTYLYQLGEWDELLRESDELVRWDREHGGTQIEISALTVGAAALAQRGRLDEAARDVAIFLPRAREIGDPQAVGPALDPGRTRLGAARATRRRSLARGGARELCGSRKSRRSRGAPCRHSDLRRRGAAGGCRAPGTSSVRRDRSCSA